MLTTSRNSNSTLISGRSRIFAGGSQLSGGGQTGYDFIKFPPKLQEIEKHLVTWRGAGYVRRYPTDTPLSIEIYEEALHPRPAKLLDRLGNVKNHKFAMKPLYWLSMQWRIQDFSDEGAPTPRGGNL